jgi:hypothetical protein
LCYTLIGKIASLNAAYRRQQKRTFTRRGGDA